MKLTLINKDNSNNIVNQSQNLFPKENLDYLYPNWHRMTRQMRWFKGSRDRSLKPDIAA